MTNVGAAPIIIGIDVGTTSVKVIAVEPESGRLAASWGREYSSQVPEPGAHEQNPDDWWRLVVTGLREVGERLDMTRVLVVGLSGHMHSLLLVDDTMNPVHAALTWADRRCADDVARLSAVSRFKDVAGNDVVAAYTAPKLAWLARSDPDAVGRASHLMLVKDYIRFLLTGDRATDRTDAIGTLLFDPRGGEWDPALLGVALGTHGDGEGHELAERLLPPVREPGSTAGSVTREAARSTGLVPGTPVVVGAGDVSAAVAGMGITGAGQVGLNVGTAAQVVALSDSMDVHGCFLFGSPWDDGFVRMASVYAAGASIRWFERALLPSGSIDDAARGSIAGARGLGYLPLMYGASVPHNDDAVQASYFGQQEVHSISDFARATVEAVAYYCSRAVNFVSASMPEATELRVVGGVSRSRIWREAMASVTNMDVVNVRDGGSAMGAVLVAGMGLGLWDSPREAAARLETAPIPLPCDSDRHRYLEAAARFDAECTRVCGTG